MVASGKMACASSSPCPYVDGLVKPMAEAVCVVPQATYLCGKILRGRLGVGIVGGNVDESVAVIFRNSFSNPLCPLDVYIFVREVPRVP
jgi:hypothetical protein